MRRLMTCAALVLSVATAGAVTLATLLKAEACYAKVIALKAPLGRKADAIPLVEAVAQKGSTQEKKRCINALRKLKE